MTSQQRFNVSFEQLLGKYDRVIEHRTVAAAGNRGRACRNLAARLVSLYPLLGVAFFPRTDAGQFVINMKSPSGTRIEVSEQYSSRVEDIVRQGGRPRTISGLIVSNIGVTPGFSSIYTSNAGPHTATVQVALKEDHNIGSYEYMARVRQRLRPGAAAPERVLPVRRHGRLRCSTRACRRRSTCS